MDQATFRILDTLSRELGSTISIRELTSKIRQYHGSAYYARTYNKLNELSKQGLVTLNRAGRSWIPSLNFADYALLDFLSEIELRKKREFIERSKTLQLLLMDMEAYAHDNPHIESISLIDPERNARLNRAELLILLHGVGANFLLRELISINDTLRNLQSARITRIDSLSLTAREFHALIVSDEINPLKEMLSGRITFHNPNSFWLNIATISRMSGKIKFEKEETNPAKISEIDLHYNLSRFGYREFGIEIRDGGKICIEYIIAAILMHGDARRSNAIPTILAKNKANYSLLIFLSQKYALSDKLLGLLKGLQKTKPDRNAASAIRILEDLGTKEIKVKQRSIERTMRLYNAIG